MAAKDHSMSPLEKVGEDSERQSDESNTADDEETAEDLPLDQAFDILKNKRRRTVLQYLETGEDTVKIGELAEAVAAEENDTPVKQVTSSERKCAYVGLYQCHLPKMDDMDIVEFNQDRGRIRAGPNADRVKRYLDWDEKTARPWPLYYGAVSSAGLALVAATALSTMAGLTPVAAVLSLLAVAGVAAAHAAVENDVGTAVTRLLPGD